MLISLLALSLAQGMTPRTSRLQQMAEAPPAVATTAGKVVMLDCRVAAKALTDCRAVGQSVDNDQMVAVALKMAADIVVPQSVSDTAQGRITVKLTVNP